MAAKILAWFALGDSYLTFCGWPNDLSSCYAGGQLLMTVCVCVYVCVCVCHKKSKRSRLTWYKAEELWQVQRLFWRRDVAGSTIYCYSSTVSWHRCRVITGNRNTRQAIFYVCTKLQLNWRHKTRRHEVGTIWSVTIAPVLFNHSNEWTDAMAWRLTCALGWVDYSVTYWLHRLIDV